MVTRPATAKFCPVCGAGAQVDHNRKLDYWYILAEEFGLEGQKGVDLTKALYKMWIPTEEPRFGNFVRATLKEYAGD